MPQRNSSVRTNRLAAAPTAAFSSGLQLFYISVYYILHTTFYILNLMPITQSAKKAMRQNIRHQAQNLRKKEAYKKLVVGYKKLIAGKKFDEAKKMLPALYGSLDKAAKTNVIAKNKASRLKSRLAQLIARSSKASS